MKRNVYRILIAALTVLMLLTAFPMGMTAAPATEGTCGENLTWRFETFGGTLIISGSGAMGDFGAQDAPWYELREEIHSVVIEEGVTTVGDCSFQPYRNLAEVSLPKTLEKIGQSAFSSTALTRVVIPDGVTYIGYGAFSACEQLEQITLPDGLTHLGDRAFNECLSLKTIVIPNGVKVIQDYTFAGASALETVTLPAGLKRITNMAFYGCPLTDVYFEGDEQQWESVAVGENNDHLLAAEFHYGRKFPTAAVILTAAAIIGVGIAVLRRKKRSRI